MYRSCLLFLPIAFILVFTVEGNFLKPKTLVSPAHNVVIDKTIELKLDKLIRNKIGDGEYLFSPQSAIMSRSKEIYVFDRIQAKIFKFDENLRLLISRERKETAASSYSGIKSPTNITMKATEGNRIIAYDSSKREFMRFDSELTSIKQTIPPKDLTWTNWLPARDKEDILLVDILGDKLIIKDMEGKVYREISLLNRNNIFLFKPPSLYISNIIQRQFYVSWVSGNILAYFPFNSLLILNSASGATEKAFIWPKSTLEDYKKIITEIKGEYSYIKFGKSLVVDSDEAGIYYIHFIEKDDSYLQHYLLKYKYPRVLEAVYSFKTQDPKLVKEFFARSSKGFYAVGQDSVGRFQEVFQKYEISKIDRRLE